MAESDFYDCFSGFWNGAVVFDEATAVGAMFIICAILWALGIPVSIVLFLRVNVLIA